MRITIAPPQPKTTSACSALNDLKTAHKHALRALNTAVEELNKADKARSHDGMQYTRIKNKFKNVDAPDMSLPKFARVIPLRVSKAGNALCHVPPELLAEINGLYEQGVLHRAGVKGDWNRMAGALLEAGLRSKLASLKERDDSEAARAALNEVITWHKRQPPRL